MTPEVELAYTQILLERTSRDPLFAEISLIVQGTDIGGLRLRPDGALFLAANMTDLIVRPLLLAEPTRWSERGLPNAGLREMLRVDIASILVMAASFAERRNLDYVSSTSVLLAVENQLATLMINETRVWGPKARTNPSQAGGSGSATLTEDFD